jgi:hypothetical protein
MHAPGGTPIYLANMHLLCGAGACGLLPAEADIIYLSNSHASIDVTVSILIGKEV